MLLESVGDAAMRIRALMLRGAVGNMMLLAVGILPAQADSLSSEALLPFYCQQGFTASPQAEDFYKGFQGKGPQHYCYGLAKLNKAYLMRSGDERNWLIDSAIGEINYVLTKNPPEDHPLVAEMYLSRGFAYRLLGKSGPALGDFLKATEIQPKSAKVYAELADLYADIKQNSKALETVTTGLRHVPGNKPLQRRYSKYGGKLPFPEPLPAPEEKKPEPVPEKGKPAVEEAGETAVAPTPPVIANQPAPYSGTARNPWCRFCPEPSAPGTSGK